MSDSIWKKELSFKRKPKEAAPAPVAPEAVTAAPSAAPAPAPAEPKQSIWKKEISFGGGSKEPKQPKAAKAPREPKQSIWKREVSLGRKKKDDDQVARLVELATRAVAPDFETERVEPVTPPTQLAEAVVSAAPAADVPSSVPPVDVLPLDAPVAVEVPPAPVFEIPPAPVVQVPPAPVVEQLPPLVEFPPAPVVEVPPVAPMPQVVPIAEAPPAPVEHHVEPGPGEQWLEPVAPAAASVAEPWLAEAQLPPAPEEATAVVVHPPVPASELPPLPAEKVPFWKKELSFGKRKTEAPAASAAPAAPAEKVPFWKKDLSFGGGKAKAPKQPRAQRGPSLPSFSLPSLPSLPSLSRGGGHQVKRLVGLKIGGSQLAAARIANNGAAELLQVARADLEPGVVVAGELRDPDSLATALKEFFAANKLPRKNVRLGIASNRIGVRTFDIVGIDDPKQLENAVHFRAQETLPIPLDEAVLDYRILEERVDAEGNSSKRVLLVVAYRELVDRYVAACKKAGITLAGIDLEAFALLRALSAPRSEEQPSDSALVAVAIGHDRSTFAVSDGRICEFTRVVEWGGGALNVAIARVLDLAPSEAEGIKRIVSLTSPDAPEGIAQEHYALALDAVRKQVQAFARELVSSLQFYQNQPGSLGIGEIVITGGTASLIGLAEELQRLIGVPVRVGDPLARLKMAKKVAVEEHAGSLAVAIGLGIED
jgi:type IV pilus assembly protein PilM